MTRRNFAGNCLITLSTLAIAVESKDWVTIASTGVNSAGREYGESHMVVIARDVKRGSHIREWCFEDSDDLDKLLGVVEAARREGPDFQIRIRWMKRPIEKSFVTLHGVATMNPDGSFELHSIEHLDVTSAGSNFQRATAV